MVTYLSEWHYFSKKYYFIISKRSYRSFVTFTMHSKQCRLSGVENARTGTNVKT